jgi:hypothetical protein
MWGSPSLFPYHFFNDEHDSQYHRTSGYDASKYIVVIYFSALTRENLIVLAGAEDVLGDLGVRQAMKKMPRDVRL